MALIRRDDRKDGRRARLRRRAEGAGGAVALAREALRGLPGVPRLLVRLMRDRRVSRLDRLLFGATLAYLLTPVDIVPDWLPGLGQADDLLLLALALYRLLHRTDEAVILEHWEGDRAPLFALRGILDRLAGMLPWWGRRLLHAG